MSNDDLAASLAETIWANDYDVVHSLEFQHAGYLVLDAAKILGHRMPKWIATNYGSDIFLYAKDPQHKDRIKEVLRRCDYYSAECRRDLALARGMGFRKKVFAVEPNGGGVDPLARRLAAPGPTSARRVIAVKGYEHFAGRALNALEALRRCKPLLSEYEIVVYAAFPEVRELADRLRSEGINIICLPDQVEHNEILALHGRSRLSIAISRADGISTSLLEAMAMGSFPIQTRTSCAEEWIEDGVTGEIVDHENVEGIALSIRKGLTNDAMVDLAAVANASAIDQRANPASIGFRIFQAYRDLQ